MNMVEEYLRAVSVMLPRETRDDIVAELRDVVLTRLEAREAQLGRPPTDDEVEDVLREIGHPLVVAARYRDEPQYVVGPVLYPFWMFGLKAAVTLQCAIAGIVFLAHLLAGAPFGAAFGQATADASEGALTLIGLATLVAWLVDRGTVTLPYFKKWRVRDLRVFDIASWDWKALGRTPRGDWRRRRAYVSLAAPRAGGALGQIAWGVVVLLWWLGALHVFGDAVGHLPALGLDEASLAGFNWAPLKALMLLPVILYAVAAIAGGAAALARPKFLVVEGALDLATGAGLVAAAWWLGYVSPLAAYLHIESLADIFILAHAGFAQGPPFPLPPLVGLALFCLGLSGLLRASMGCWKLLALWKGFPVTGQRPQVGGV